MRTFAMMIVLGLIGSSVSVTAQHALRRPVQKHPTPRVVTCAPVAKVAARTSHVRRVAERPRYRIVRERVWIRGHYDRVWQPPEYGVRYDSCGNRVRFVVRHGGYRKVWVPGRWETRTRKVLVHGHRRFRR